MTTTKKVASKRSTSKTKSDSKKTVARKKPAKKKNTTNAKKTSEKKSTKRVAKKKQTKKVSVKKKAVTKKTFQEKLAKKEAIYKNTSVVNGGTSTESSKTHLQLVALSPYRFPLHIDSAVIQTARYSGLFFVLLGAFFTMFYAQFISSNNSIVSLTSQIKQSANVCDASSPYYDPYDPSCSNETTFNGTYPSSTETTTLDPTPAASFSVHASEPLAGIVDVMIDVPYAERVEVAVFDKASLADYKLGSALYQSGDTWTIDWDTAAYPDGEYRLRAYILNEFGTYEEKDSIYYMVENTPVEESTTTETGVTPNTTTSSTTKTETVNTATETNTTSVVDAVSIHTVDTSKVSPFSGDVTFNITTANADQVKLIIKNIDTGIRHAILNAYERDIDVWRSVIKTNNYPDGKYRITIQALDGLGDQDTSVKEVLFKNEASTTVVTETEEVEPTPVDTTKEPVPTTVAPDMQLQIRASSPISGYVDVRVDVAGVSFVELYAVPKASAQDRFLGLAKKVDTDRWLYRWNTTELPNGEYKVFARVKNSYGVFSSDYELTMIYNEVVETYTDTQREEITTLEDVHTEELSEETPAATTEVVVSDTDDDSNEIDTLFDAFREEFEVLLQRLATAIRSGDQNAVDGVKRDLESFKSKVIASRLDTDDIEQLVARIDERIQTAVVRVEEDVERTNRIIVERTGESASKDSDSDGVTDYDEINIYNTNPFSADTDNDGFPDGAEILGGYNPTDDTVEVLLAYESPKESGIVREDILQVSQVTTGIPDEEDTDGNRAEAIITGTALPNSYVTLYIYSTPIVVTIRTDADGSWLYRFDKELEDGEHEVYVGITDNAGKIVAKSSPYRFIKTAEAFTAAEAASGITTTAPEEESLFSSIQIYLTLSISVVAIGLVLILLGVHLDTRRKLTIAESVTEAEPSV